LPFDEAAAGALFTPVHRRTPEQAARVAQDGRLIAELRAADREAYAEASGQIGPLLGRSAPMFEAEAA
jgi:hypothetical protein